MRLSLPSRVLPPIYFLICAILMVALHIVDPFFQWGTPVWRVVGAIAIGVGLMITGWANGQFRRAGTPVRPFEEAEALVTGGVFRFSRNPMYLGMVIMLFGIAVLLGSLMPLVVIPVFIWVISRYFIGIEEELMESHFGDRYREYRDRVRRWL